MCFKKYSSSFSPLSEEPPIHGQRSKKRNSQKVLGVPRSADLGSGRCPDTLPLEVVEPTDIPALISQLPHLRAIVTTGEKATETICASLGISTIPKVNTSSIIHLPSSIVHHPSSIALWRLPSSSRAYPLSFDKKVEAYRQVLNLLLL